MEKMTKKSHMKINVILTFNKPEPRFGDTQEMFNVSIPLGKQDKNYDVFSFFERKFFPVIIKSCSKYKRDHKDLIKISTCSDWDFYESFTENKSLYSLNHSCKWFFGMNRFDLDSWEKKIMRDFEFGTNADMANIDKTKEMLEQYEINLLEGVTQ
jgi:hypothetical protein